MKCDPQKCEFAEIQYAVLHKDDDNTQQESPQKKHGLSGDMGNIMLLMFLYILQGIPLGLTASVPLLLQSWNVGYDVQAKFSFVNWPFSMKLLWAPIVDSLFIKRIGRRKTWLMPTQYLIGFFMLYMSRNMNTILGHDDTGQAQLDLSTLVFVFFVLNFLAATQDISLDGWAICMLQR